MIALLCMKSCYALAAEDLLNCIVGTLPISHTVINFENTRDKPELVWILYTFSWLLLGYSIITMKWNHASQFLIVCEDVI